ncbi:MAG: ABC transporter permease, partial [Clostridia bacterium]
FGIPFPVLLFAFAAIAAAIVARKTAFGRSVYAIGGNESAAEMMGISVQRSKAISYILTGVLSAVAGVILCSRLGAGQPLSGQGWEMDAISAVAIGGTLLSGGVGGIGKTVCGVLIIGFIRNIINLQGNINSYWQNIIMGVIILAVIIFQNRGKRSCDHE